MLTRRRLSKIVSNGSIANRKFSTLAANRWCWVDSLEHTHSRARSHDMDARIKCHCSRSHSQPSSILTAKQLPLDDQPLAVARTCLYLRQPGRGFDHISVGDIPGSTVLCEHARYVEPNVVLFYLNPSATSRSPGISEWHDGQSRLVNGKVY